MVTATSSSQSLAEHITTTGETSSLNNVEAWNIQSEDADIRVFTNGNIPTASLGQIVKDIQTTDGGSINVIASAAQINFIAVSGTPKVTFTPLNIAKGFSV